MDRHFPLNQRSDLFYLEEDMVRPTQTRTLRPFDTLESSDGKVGQSFYVPATLEASLAWVRWAQVEKLARLGQDKVPEQ